MINIISASGAKKVYADQSYLFYSHELNGQDVTFGGDVEVLLYVSSGIFSLEQKYDILPGDTVTIKNSLCTISGTGVLHVVQAPLQQHDYQMLVSIDRCGSHYKVSKPWGYELWLNGQHPTFCAKKIFIKQGTQTSLQYHNFKEESNLIESGTAILVSQKNLEVPLDKVMPVDLQEQVVTGQQCIHVTPRTIHRLRAETDLHLFEVSTPFLDDVIRLHDDANRSNGRIESEHTT